MMLFDKYLQDVKEQLGINHKPTKSRLAKLKRFFGKNEEAITLKYNDGELIHHYKEKLKSSGLKNP